MRDILKEIWTTITHNRLRTVLTGFSVAWGIFILIVLLGAGNGLINGVMGNRQKVLTNSMTIYGGQTSIAHDGLGMGRSIELNDKDMEITKQGFTANIDDVGAEIKKSGQTLAYTDNYMTGVNVNGVFPNDEVINKREMLCGRFLNQPDMSQRRKTIVVSEGIAKELMPKAPLNLNGRTVKAGNIAFTVVGIYDNDKSRMGNDAFIPFTTFRTIYNSGDKTGDIVFSFHGLKTEDDNALFENDYRARINRIHRADPSDENSIWIWNRFTQDMQMNKATGMISTALWVVGILTLLSGIVGVSNIMLITVRERTHEFGIRKAIGAKPWSILRLIIIESVAITTFFGYIGMVLGIAATQYMDATIGQTKVDNGLFSANIFINPTVSIGICVQATILMIIAGTIAGLIPARKAAKIRPIEALRAE